MGNVIFDELSPPALHQCIEDIRDSLPRKQKRQRFSLKSLAMSVIKTLGRFAPRIAIMPDYHFRPFWVEGTIVFSGQDRDWRDVIFLLAHHILSVFDPRQIATGDLHFFLANDDTRFSWHKLFIQMVTI